MAKISLQFHADRTELLHDLLPSWLDGMALHMVQETFFPQYRAAVISLPELRDVDADQVSRLGLSPEPIDARVGSAAELLAANPGMLLTTPGTEAAEGLRESMLGATTEDPARIELWRTVQRRARRSLSRGAYVVNPQTGVRKAASNHLYSAGAASLAERGVPLLAVAGWNRYELDPDPKSP